MPPQDEQKPQVTDTTQPQPSNLDFSAIQGHIAHGTVASKDPMVQSMTATPDILGAASGAWNDLRQTLRDHSGDHPLLGHAADKMDAIQEMMFGGQSVGKPMGTSGGVADEAQFLAGAADAPEQLESAVNTAGKGLSAIKEAGQEFVSGIPEELEKWTGAKTPAARTNEAGRVSLDFSSVPGHQTVEPAPQTQTPPAEKQPRYAYRGKKVSEQGISGARYDQASSSPEEAHSYVKTRHEQGGEPHHVVRVDLNKLPKGSYDISGGMNMPDLVRFNQAVPNEMLEEVDESGNPKPPRIAPNEQSVSSAQRYNAAHGMAPIDHSADELPSAEDRAALADAYDAAKHEPNNPAVQRAYSAMKKETLDQFNHAKNDLGINIEFQKEDPYKNADEMSADVRNNHRLKVFKTGEDFPADHPMAEVEPTTGMKYNDLFRATHDIYGHTAGGHDFTEAGEANAYKAHNQMYSDEAKPAVRTETLGQSNWVSNNKDVREGRAKQYENFAQQKATILPEAEKNEPVDEGTIKDSVETAGGVYRGINKGAKGERIVEITLPPEMADKLNVRPEMKKHISVNLPAEDVNEENVRNALQRKFQEFGGKLTDLQPKSEVEQLKEAYPTTKDPSSALRGASFITPEGDYMPLGAGDEHFKAIEKTRTPDQTAPRNKQVMQSRQQLPEFLESNGLVRTRYRQDRGGATLHISVPENVTPEQVQSIKMAVGKNRNGNIVLENTKTGEENKSMVREFASPADVDVALHQIGLHPEGWSNKATKMMQEQPAGAIDPRTGKTDTAGFGVEVFPEARAAREPLTHPPTKSDVESFYNDHKELFDKHPELRVGWDKTDKGWELNVGASAANQAGAETVGRNLDQRAAWDIAGQKEIPTGGKGAKTKFGQYPLEDRLADLSGKNVSKLPPTIKNSRHLTDGEKYLLGSDSGALRGFKDTKKKIASVQELAETAKAGEANRFWYDRARASFNSMFDALPKGSFPAEDRDKFIGLVAATSPRSDVVENIAASLNAYRAWVAEGRPTDPMSVREAVDSSLIMPGSHGPNAARALTGQELSGPKVTSFLKNFMGSQQHVTNDMWGALTNGIMDAKELSNPGSYIALSENYRKAAESLGWTPQQAQAASWGFVRTLGNMAGFGGKQAGADKPAETIIGMIDDPTVRKYSADIAEIFLTSGKVRDRLEQLGVNLEDFDARLGKSIEQFQRGGEGQTRGTRPQLLARTAEKVEQGKRYVRAQAAAGKRVNEKAMPLLEGVMSGKKQGKRTR